MDRNDYIDEKMREFFRQGQSQILMTDSSDELYLLGLMMVTQGVRLLKQTKGIEFTCDVLDNVIDRA